MEIDTKQCCRLYFQRSVGENLELKQTVSKPKIHQHCILPRKYIRQRRQLLFLVYLQVSEKSGVMNENC
jgi:hypothetical protein